jgi:uncharacterized protein
MRRKLIIMLKYPRLGAVKTRLVPALGERRAYALYKSLAQHALGEAKQLCGVGEISVEVSIADGPDDAGVREWLGSGLDVRRQGEGDLGQRMGRAVRDAFAEGASSVVLMGADCPELTAERLAAAFDVLEGTDVVLGPAADGGYYLIGMRRLLPEVFRGIQWGSERVLEQTLHAARAAGIEWRLLDTLSDVDRPEDLPVWAKTTAAQAAGKGGISVILPARNEAQRLAQTLEAAGRGDPYEIMVVDGGSADGTREIARAAGTMVLSCPPRRATQMNLGARVATGEYFLFLHADTILPEGYPAHVRKVLGSRDIAAGAFEFAIGDAFTGRGWVERAANWRARRWQLPYGDQALFLRRETFLEQGGFPDLPIMEDYVFVRRLRQFGKIAIAPAAAKTSGRRWQQLGIVRTTLLNQAIILGYHLGVSPSRLASWYGNSAGRTHRTIKKLEEAGLP